MQKRLIKTYILLVLVFILIPIAEGLTEHGGGNLACTTTTSTIVPRWGGSAEILPDRPHMWNIAVPVGEPRSAYIHNDYIGRLYEGGLAFDFTVTQSERHLDEPIIFDLAGRAGGKIRRGVVSQPNPLIGQMAFFFPPESIVGGEGIGGELLPPDMGAELFDGNGNPVAPTFPATCPRLASTRFLLGLDQIDRGINAQVIADPRRLEQLDHYDTMLDPKNNPPDDIQQNNGGTWNFDCSNVLCINRVDASFDWENANLVIGTNDDGDVTEGMGVGCMRIFTTPLSPANRNIGISIKDF